MSETLVVALISSVIGGLLVAIVNQWFIRRRIKAEALKLEAEAERIRAETSKLLSDTEFETVERKLRQGSIPPHGWFLSGGDPTSYRVGVDREIHCTSEASGFIESTKKPWSTGTLMQRIKGTEYRGKRVRMVGYVKSKDVQDWSALWFRVDGPEKQALCFDNMHDRPIRGTTDWQGYELVLDVPDEAIKMSYGVILSGEGKVWIDSLRFDVVDNSVPTTDLIDYKKDIAIQDSPSNLDFQS